MVSFEAICSTYDLIFFAILYYYIIYYIINPIIIVFFIYKIYKLLMIFISILDVYSKNNFYVVHAILILFYI